MIKGFSCKAAVTRALDRPPFKTMPDGSVRLMFDEFRMNLGDGRLEFCYRGEVVSESPLPHRLVLSDTLTITGMEGSVGVDLEF